MRPVLTLDSTAMPRLMPSAAAPVATTIMMITRGTWTAAVFGTPHRYDSPACSSKAPSPRLVTMDTMVASTPKPSTAWPTPLGSGLPDSPCKGERNARGCLWRYAK
ncbi:hypothetical protein D3C73_1147210 [compost metagenome]